MFDTPDDPETESVYECLRCGEIVTSEDNPGECPVCGGSLQNRAMSLE